MDDKQSIQKFELSNGQQIPVLGYGTYEVPADKMEANILTALQSGYRHIDCAFFYENEKAIGEGLKQAMHKLHLKREDIFVTSKVWPTHMRPEYVRKSVEQSLKDLQLSYLDLCLVHWPVAFKPDAGHWPLSDDCQSCALDLVPHMDTWKAMEKLVDDGLTKSIGLSNFNKRQIDHILANCRIKPVNLQIEIHANFPNEKLVNYAHSKGLTVSAYAPLGSPGGFYAGSTNLLTQTWVRQIADKHKRTPSQVLLRYLIQRQIIVLPKSSTSSRIVENAQLFDFELSDDEMQVLHTSGVNQRQFVQECMRLHPEYPFDDEY